VLVYAQIAYHESDPAACAAELGHSSLTVAHTVSDQLFDGASIFGYTALDKSRNRVIVGFNGNVETRELARRLLRGRPMKIKNLCKGCKTHRLWADANSRVCPELAASVRTITKRHPDFDVIITGHGVGGGLAALCGYEMEMARVFEHSNTRTLITYGQPRVGNAHWARKFHEMFPSAIRVTHGDDPVVHIAPCHADQTDERCIEVKDRKLKLWAFHAPTQIWYPHRMPSADVSEQGEYRVCSGANWGEDVACRNRPLGFSMDDAAHYFGVNVPRRCSDLLAGAGAGGGGAADGESGGTEWSQ